MLLHVLPASLLAQIPAGQPNNGHDQPASVHSGAMGSPQQPVHDGWSLPSHAPASLLPQMPTGQPRSGQTQPEAVHSGAMDSSQQPVHEGSVPVHAGPPSAVFVPPSPVPVSVAGVRVTPPHAVVAAKRRAKARSLMTVHGARDIPGRRHGIQRKFRRSPCARARQGATLGSLGPRSMLRLVLRAITRLARPSSTPATAPPPATGHAPTRCSRARHRPGRRSRLPTPRRARASERSCRTDR